MSFAASITRAPLPFDTDRAAEIAARFAAQPAEVKEVLAGTGGCSPYLHGLMLRHADWLEEALDMAPEAVLPAVMATVGDATAPRAVATALRQAKARVALFVGLADLAGVWPLEKVTGALTDFADFAVGTALAAQLRPMLERGKLPGQGPADLPQAAGMCVLAMGKMGAHELNYSSDIDLICLFDETRFSPDDFDEARMQFVRATRNMAAALSEPTADGYVFRTDLRLRPDASVTPVCLSMEAAERYYESVGRTWERAAYIKARPSAGDLAAGEAFLQRLRPFIWRKHLDFAAIQDAHDMRLRIRDHKGLHGAIAVPGHDLKLGAGGIREIEFFTQTRQLIAGGRDAGLRQRETVRALRALSERGWVAPDVAEALVADYRAHREVEHRIQMVADAQTHRIPTSDEGIARIAAMRGQDADAFRAELAERLARVAELTEEFFAPAEVAGPGADLPEAQAEMLERWRSYPALRSARAQAIFDRIAPDLLRRFDRAANPQEALNQFDRFLAGLPAGVQVFSLFSANPHLIDLMVDIAATAPQLAAYLGRNSAVFDAVIGGDFFAPWPGAAALAEELSARLAEESDYERILDAARRWQKEWHFRIGVHHLRGLIDADEAGAQYAGLADAVLTAIWPHVLAEFARKHGAPPGRGAVVLGMGSVGSARLTAASDLDLIVIYDDQGVETSDGPRPLATRPYYARLTQALVTALSAPMAEGRLYEVDMRLRPSGRQGPVATAFSAFVAYQRDEAWTWEHMALTRARPITGEPTLAEKIEAFRREIVRRPREAGAILADMAEMRWRIAEAKQPGGALEAKIGPGRLQDIELLAQAAALVDGAVSRAIPQQLDSLQSLGWVDAEGVAALRETYALMWRLQSAARLLTGEALDMQAIGEGGRQFVLRETGCDSADALEKRVSDLSRAAAELIDGVVAAHSG